MKVYESNKVSKKTINQELQEIKDSILKTDEVDIFYKNSDFVTRLNINAQSNKNYYLNPICYIETKLKI